MIFPKEKKCIGFIILFYYEAELHTFSQISFYSDLSLREQLLTFTS